jgi:hypothetical protein
MLTFERVFAERRKICDIGAETGGVRKGDAAFAGREEGRSCGVGPSSSFARASFAVISPL